MIGDEREIERTFRQRWYEAHVRRMEGAGAEHQDLLGRLRRFGESADEALAVRDELARSGDVEAFRSALQLWAVKPTTLAFNGFSGQMMVNQLVKKAPEPAVLAEALTLALSPPEADAEAAEKIRALADFVTSIRVGAHPAPGHVPFLLSYFWSLAKGPRWPVIWSSAASFAEYVSGTTLPAEPSDRYLAYLRLVAEVDQDSDRFVRTALWWDATKPVFLDAVIADRCAYGLDRHAASFDALAVNAAALVNVAEHLGGALVAELAAASGRSLVSKKPARLWAEERPRSDLWADWWTQAGSGLGLRLWVNHSGASMGLRPGMPRKGWYDEVLPLITGAQLPGFKVIAGGTSKQGEDVGHLGGMAGEFAYGRWFDPSTFDSLDVRSEMTAVATALRPLLDELVQRATGERAAADDPLASAQAWFVERGYPSPADVEHRADREQFAAMLAEESIALVDPADLRRIWNTRRYGSPGPQSVLNTSLRDADAAEHDRIIGAISYVCWGEGEDAARIDDVLSGGAHSVKGLGESVIMKLLAICHPDRYLPVFPYSGPKGKRRMLQLLGLAEPVSETRGGLQVMANDLLRQRLDRLFPGDPWGMAQFLYRHAERTEEAVEPAADVDPLDEVAEELLIDRAFLDDIVALLRDKGQVILYGPPGTGKTYLARKLAEALVPDPTRRSLVQFHPSTSYEDFFEGYRPETSLDGTMTYRLTPGPLALLAARAADSPGKRHIMIIDEINRANLPRVLGELLFLFEYREEQVRTLYRPDDAFELPRDVWFIGTMNTADRSVALVDAALRRRFHFVPFFPNHGPMEGLLDRWLAHHGEEAWIGQMVAMVNGELEVELGGPHLQLGPSHFMRKGLDLEGMRRIWQYNIEPFLEDQFFGDQVQIERFRFGVAHARFLADVAPLEVTAPSAEEP